MSSPYVFISYSRQDREFVERLSRELQGAGIKTWTDTQNISAGANWQQEIEKGLLQADALLYVASGQASSSNWIEYEVEAFRGRNGRVIPLVIDNAGAESMPASLRRIQWVDFRGDFQSAFAALLGGLQELRGTTAVKPVAAQSKGYVFISYASEDIAFVRELKSFLAERGYSFWDFQTSKRNYQLDYTLELEERISNAEATLSVVSPDWKKSTRALQELHFSNEVGTPVFLLRLKNPGPTLALAGLTFIDFTEAPSSGFEKLASEMQAVGL
jgi:hypothetical protein